MKSLRRTCTAIVLCLAIAVSTFAGQISSPGYVPPPPPPPSEPTNVTTTIILAVISLIR